MKNILPYIAIVLAMVIWSGAGIAVKASLLMLTPLQLVLVRFTLSVVVMFAIGICGRMIIHSDSASSVIRLQGIQKQDWWLFLLAGIFQPFLYFILETYSYRCFSSPTMAEPFLSASPLLSPIFAYWILKEKVSATNIIGIIVSTIGMLMLVLIGNQQYEIGNPWGIPLALLTSLMAVGYSIILKRIPERYSALSIVFWVQLIALFLFYLTWLITDRSLPHIDFASANCHQMIWGVSYLALLAGAGAFILFCYSVRYIGVTRANAFNNIRPVFTALLMWWLMNEHLPTGKFIGIIIVIIGLFISQKK